MAALQKDSLLPVPQNSLADIVTAQLRTAIVSGQLAAGEKLTEVALAERLAVSRSPVREALKRLENQGLVRSQLNYSTYVWDPSEKDVEEIVNLRNMIEIYSTEQVINSLTEDDLRQLDRIIADQEHDIQEEAYLDLVRSDRDFHEYIVRKSGNSRLIDWWDQIMDQWTVLVARRWRFDTEKVIPRVLQDHRRIYEALKSRSLEQLIGIHRTINSEVCEETKRMLRTQTLGNEPTRQLRNQKEEVAQPG